MSDICRDIVSINNNTMANISQDVGNIGTVAIQQQEMTPPPPHSQDNVWVIYGGHGWIGRQIAEILGSEKVICGNARAENRHDVGDELKSIVRKYSSRIRVICVLGRTSGPGCSNIDYLEDRLVDNLRDNLHAPMVLAQVCLLLGIHMTYIGTGCIYEYDVIHKMPNFVDNKWDLSETTGWNEFDPPNFNKSAYSAVKGITNDLIRSYPNVLQLRIRMPIVGYHHPRNFITKITTYKDVISIPNSMTILPELLPMAIIMARDELTGTYNFTNPGVISHGEILDLYKKYVDPEFTYNIVPDLPYRRSNNYLDTSRIESLFPNIRPIKDAIIDVFSKWK